MCGGDADNSEVRGNISGDLGGEGILVVFSESSVNGETCGVDGDVSDGDIGGNTSKGDVDGDICGELAAAMHWVWARDYVCTTRAAYR